MGHHHPHHGHHGHDHGPDEHHSVHGGGAIRALKLSLIVTLTFMVVEIVGGYLANSLALISDGVHMATDAAALAFSLFTIWLSKRPAKSGFTFGYQRVEILGALLSGLTVWLIAGFLIFESIERMDSPPAVRGGMVFVIATIGLIANLISVSLLHAKSKESLNVRAAYLHVLTDCLGSVAAMISGVVIWLTGWGMIDPIITCVLSALMLWSSWRLISETVGILMERMPEHLSSEKIIDALAAIPDVEEVHDLHVWTLSSGKVSLSVHLTSRSPHVLAAANSLLLKEFGINHTTIQVEVPDNDLAHSDDCASGH